MAFFIVTMSHPNEKGWGQHVQAHITYLRKLEQEGRLRASGAIVDAPVKTGCLILTAADRADVERLIAGDPFAIHGIIAQLNISEWDPYFGIFASESSGNIQGQV